MRLDEFTFIPFDARDKALEYLANVIGRPTAQPDALYAELDSAFAAAVEAGAITYRLNDEPLDAASISQADAAYFRTGLTTADGNAINAKFVLNRRPGSRQKWFGLFFETEATRRDGLFIGDLFFPNWHQLQTFLDDLAERAIPEKWTYSDFESKQKTPILKSLVEQTYLRLKEQARLLTGDGLMLFNTGLINGFFKELYVLSEVDAEHPERYLNARVVLENDRMVMETFADQKPPMATFFENIGDVVFDPDLPLLTSDEHILVDNFERLPEEYKQMRKSQLFALFQAAVGFARVMARRNYKLVVPQYHKGRIQFLMPIYLAGEFAGSPDFALVVERINNVYRGNTILTLDMAYQNARLIAKPDTTWLDPEAISRRMAGE